MTPWLMYGGDDARPHLGDQVSALIDGQLGHDQRERILAHLAHCASCRSAAEAERRTRETLSLLDEPRLPPALFASLLAIPQASWSDDGGPQIPRRGQRLEPDLLLAALGEPSPSTDMASALGRGGFKTARPPARSQTRVSAGSAAPSRAQPNHDQLDSRSGGRYAVRVAAVGAFAAVVGSLGFAALSAGSLAGPAPTPMGNLAVTPSPSPGATGFETVSLTSPLEAR